MEKTRNGRSEAQARVVSFSSSFSPKDRREERKDRKRRNQLAIPSNESKGRIRWVSSKLMSVGSRLEETANSFQALIINFGRHVISSRARLKGEGKDPTVSRAKLERQSLPSFSRSGDRRLVSFACLSREVEGNGLFPGRRLPTSFQSQGWMWEPV